MNDENKIKQQFQSAFSDFQAPVPEDGWSRLEKSLMAADAAKAMRSRWYIGSAAAVLIALIGSLLFLQNPVTDTDPMVSEVVSPPDTRTGIDTPLQETTPIIQPRQTAPTFAERTRTGDTKAKDDSRQMGTSENIASHTLKQQTTALPEQEKPLAEKPQDRMKPAERKKQAPDKETDQAEIERLIEEFARAGERTDLFAGAGKEKEERNIMLALNGKGGLTSFQKTVNSPMTLRSATVAQNEKTNLPDAQLLLPDNKDPGNKNIMATNTNKVSDNVAEMEHAQPVSFGLTVSKSFTDDLSVETGLVYTYLHSRAKNTHTDFNVKETQHLHYLGIPLNVNYVFLNIEKLDVYASLGGMIEKDVSGEFRSEGKQTVNELNNSNERIETVKIKQEHPQVSVNAGVGISYPVYGGINIYGKIGGSYYFDANNPYKTIYSDKKIILDLNIGLRVEF